MGDHYIPKYYLKGFTVPSQNIIWVYEKGSTRKFQTHIKNIGHQTKFYPTKVEQYLANQIENPANAVIRKIREREEITKVDKSVLSEYMVVMMKRVPQAKKRLKEMAPDVAKKLFQELDKDINALLTLDESKAEFYEKRRAEILNLLDKLAKDPPEKIWSDNITPERTPLVTSLIPNMTWRFLTYDEKPVFLTSDNPLFFFQGLGIGNRESEITFPISSNITLWATWRKDLAQGYFQTNMRTVKEVNRRTASNSTIYVYHAADEEWILLFVNKRKHQLHKLR